MPNTYRGNPLPTFPATWYHPVYGAREIKDYAEFTRLDDDWRETAAKADMDRTETEARMVMNHNDQLKREAVLRAGGQDAIVRNSVQSAEAIKRGEPQPL